MPSSIAGVKASCAPPPGLTVNFLIRVPAFAAVMTFSVGLSASWAASPLPWAQSAATVNHWVADSAGGSVYQWATNPKLPNRTQSHPGQK